VLCGGGVMWRGCVCAVARREKKKGVSAARSKEEKEPIEKTEKHTNNEGKRKAKNKEHTGN
jgi:hypothetical protein